MPFTSGFDPALLADHFTRHGADFGVTTEAAYELLADRFLGGPRDPATLECIRASNGDIVRYNPFTNEFGVLKAIGVIKTYYKPDPRIHRQPTNLAYFYAECLK